MKKINKKYIIVGGLAIIIIALVIVSSGKSDAGFESAKVSVADVVQNIDVTGKIAAEQKADLAFERAGTVSLVSVKVGDKVVQGQVLGSLDTREAKATYQSAQANVLSEQAKLNESENGTRKEELSISGASYTNEVQSFSTTIRNVFPNIEEALRTTTDTLFYNANSVNPSIDIHVSMSDSKKKEVELMRLKITEYINKWNKEYVRNNPTPEVSVPLVKATILQTKSFLDLFSTYIKGPSDEQREIILSAQTQINDINQTFVSAQAAYDSARGGFVLKRAGNTTESVRSQQAKVEQAIAQALSSEAALQKMTLTAPFSGIVTLVKPVLGETISAGDIAFTVMTAEQYKIEVFVPESNIAKINIGNVAKVTLDAYGKETVFDATVTLIDPAETIVEGIPTYKVTLSIDTDPRIRSGMTADIKIITSEKKGVVSIPTRALIEKEGRIYVRKINGDKYEEVPVEIGLKGSNGNTELVNGLNIGDSVVTKIK